MSETVEIRYTCPVYVTVDLESEKVTRVVVDDTGSVLDTDFVRGIRRRENAARIAEEATWPEWDTRY